MKEILIVDDERSIRTGLKTLLEGEGYGVRLARDGEEAVRLVTERRPDLVLLDAMMPRKNGFRTCEEIRGRDATLPIVFLTALDGESDEVRAFGLGADDYLPKSVSPTRMLAHVRRALEKTDKELSDETRIRLGIVTVDLTSGDVSWNRQVEKLTATELDLLKFLLENPNRYVDKNMVVTALRGSGFACVDSMIYSHVSNLRRKLGPAGCSIACDRSFGYRLRR